MAEAIGAVASVISIIGLAKTCIDLYAIIDECRHASKDQNRLISQIKEQRLRFFIWCDVVGITECLQQQQTTGRRIEMSSDLTLRTLSRPSSLQQSFVHKEICAILERILQLFDESSQLLKDYAIQKDHYGVSNLVKMTSHNNLCFGIAESSSASELHPRELAANKKSSMSVWQTSKWTMNDRKRLTQLVELLRLSNDGLQSILGMLEIKQMQRMNQILATTTPFASVVIAAHDIESPTAVGLRSEHATHSERQHSPLPPNDAGEVRQLVELYRQGYAIDQDINSNKSTENPIAQESLMSPSLLFESTCQLSESDLALPDTSDFLQRRLSAVYKSTPVIVEWKYYSTRLSQKRLVALKRRVSMLAQQLQRSSQTAGFHTMGCLGYFDNSEMYRIGMAFEYPCSKITMKPISLKERIIQDRRNKINRDLASRYTIAKALVMAIYRLHSVGWLHKSFRSENVMFFEQTGQDNFSLADPFVCGFDFSRQDSPSEMTEDIPSVLSDRYMDREQSLYRHPDLDIQAYSLAFGHESPEESRAKEAEADEAASKFRYRKLYDVYSLGIILLEIGLWYPVKHLCNVKDSLESNRKILKTQVLAELRYRMGSIYHDVVKRCLDGDVGHAYIQSAVVAQCSDPEALALRDTRIWLAGFDKYIVSELERCLV